MDETDRRSFADWMQAVDRFVYFRGVSVYDLPDCPFRDWYDERIRPIHAANKALRRAGAYCE
jgi:hypothetical protein